MARKTGHANRSAVTRMTELIPPAVCFVTTIELDVPDVVGKPCAGVEIRLPDETASVATISASSGSSRRR